MGVAVVNFLLGALVKILSTGAGKFFAFKEKKELMIASKDVDMLKALQSGEDKADGFTRWTRRIIALAFVVVFLKILWEVTVVQPDIQFTVMVPKSQSWFWRLMNPFPVTDQGTMLVSAGSILWDAWKGIWLILGFYFTKVGK